MKSAIWIAIFVAVILIICTVWIVGTDDEAVEQEQQQSELSTPQGTNGNTSSEADTPVIITGDV